MKVAFGRQQLSKRVRQPGPNISWDYARRTVDALTTLENPLLYAVNLLHALSRVSLRANGNARPSDGWLRRSRISFRATAAKRRNRSHRASRRSSIARRG
jgi:hypothetical protein